MENFNDKLNELMTMAEESIGEFSEDIKGTFTVDEGFYDRVKMPKRFQGVTFETHPNNATETVKSFCTRKRGGVLMLIGPVGTGKTETACCSFIERAKAGLKVGEYLNVEYQMCPMYRSSRLSNSPQTEYQFFDHFYKLPFLVLDEVGHGDDSDIERKVLSNIIDACYDNDTKIICTTNMTMKEFCDFMGDRTTDRLHQIAEVCVLNGNTWRK